MNNRKQFTTKLINFITAFLIVLSVSFAIFGVFLGSKEEAVVVKADDKQSYTISSISDLIDYINDYRDGHKNPKDVLTFSNMSDSTLSDYRHISIGTQSRPFAGTFILPETGVDTFVLYDIPLFDYVTTDFTISGASSLKIRRIQKNNTSGSLFANHVVQGEEGAKANWSIELVPHAGNETQSTEFECVIGDIAADCDVSVTFKKTATSAGGFTVSRANGAGLICGSVGARSSLSVSTVANDGANSTVSVTATSGNAGSLVGEMGAGAKLKINSANNTFVSSVTSTNGYAGGLVGKMTDVTVSDSLSFGAGVSTYDVTGPITGKTGAGGLFGYYKNSYSDTPSTVFTLNNPLNIVSNVSVSSGTYTGGVFGKLENTAAFFTFDGYSKSISPALDGGTYRGGVAGSYQADSLARSFEIKNAVTAVNTTILNNNYIAGLLGNLENNDYVNVHDVTCTTTGSLNGGLIGLIKDASSFVDVTGNIVISGSGSFDAGLIANMPQGVLRLSGAFDLSGFRQYQSSSAYLVKDRNRALVYALGDGNGTNGNWSLKRNLSRSIDDIHSWGQVIRADGVSFSESDLFTVDMTAHTVTVKAAVTAIGSVTDFAKTALNVKLNTDAGVGPLQFTSGSANLSSTLLSNPLSLTADIDLRGTGLLGLTRDDGANNSFSSTFNGGNHTITFSTGEEYGLQSDGSALPADSKQGNIYQHGYSGLFAKTSGATFNNLTLSGQFYMRPTSGGTRLGAAVAYATNGLTVSGVTSNITINVTAGNVDLYYGGLIGVADGSGLNVSVSDCNIRPNVVDQSAAGSERAYFGGAIASVNATESTSPTQTINFSKGVTQCSFGITYSKTNSTDRASLFGALIARVSNCNYGKDKRQIGFSDIDVSVTATGGRTGNREFGAIFGVNWFAADVTVNDVRINSTSITVAGGSSADFGGLVRYATGHWSVEKITVNSASYSIPSGLSDTTFGFVACKAFINGDNNAKSALYLDVDNTGSNYNIGSFVFTSAPTFVAFDELVADTRFNGQDITDNGNAVVSVTTSNNLINTAGSYNTYLNKTAYGQTASGKINSRSRYYYNLSYARGQLSTPKYKFLVWSVKTYAHSSLSAWFNVSSPFSGDLDMTGLSYYPVDLTENVVFNSTTTIKLDNILMDNNVKYAYSGETGTRSTRSNTNQHYLMHTAVFRNVTGNMTVNGTTMQGNVPNISSNFCGFLIAGTLGGSDVKNVVFEASGLVFDGVKIVSAAGVDISGDVYAPLLINKIGKKSTLSINGAEQSSYSTFVSSGKYAASSLIGDVGDNSARGIYLTFSGLKLDGRSAASSVGNLNTAYGTTRSIFCRSTILNSFRYVGESRGSYTFEIGDDWTNSTTAVHNVTYGREITSSVEFSGKQETYSASVYFTHPTTYQAASAYDFSSGFLPYVYVAYDLAEFKHEISVNISFSSAIEGCGKFDDPFIIDDDNKLPIISNIIYGTDVSSDVQLYLPNDLTSFDYSARGYTKYQYSFGLTNYAAITVGAPGVTNANARKYLAGAYYVITKDIELPDDYVSLGEYGTDEYSFRGVLIGYNAVITNKSDKPLIKTSLGSVVKDLTVNVDVDKNDSTVITLAAPAGDGVFAYSGGNNTYGAVIGRILGGDNIIDNVNVTFSENVSFNVTANETSTFSRLVPIGGYVGTLLNGGLIFRNMSGEYVGLTNSTTNLINNDGYLYVNPIIGRVIEGYAFCEAASFSVYSSTIDNGNKNYSIADLSLSAGKLSVTNVSSVYTISVPDGQALFILAAAINGGACSAPTGGNLTNSITAYNLLYAGGSFNALTDFWQAYRNHTATHGSANYSFVGTKFSDSWDSDTKNEYNKADLDKYTANSNKVPYILRAYTSNDNSCLYMRSVATRNTNVVEVTGDCTVPAGFRGIGSIYVNNDLVRLRLNKVSGKYGGTNSRTITLDMRYLEYNHKSVSSYIAVADTSSPNSTAGFGLFTRLDMTSPSSSNCVEYLTLSGSVFYDVYTIGGVQANYNFPVFNNSDRTEKGSIKSNNTEDATQRITILSVGGLAGYANKRFYISNVTFNDLYVEGAKSAGGMIGYVHVGDTNNISNIVYDGNGENEGFVNVVGGIQAGGLIGRIYRTGIEITGAEGGTDLKIKNVESKNSNPDETGMQYYANVNTGVGGVVGTCWAIDKKTNGTGGSDSGESYLSKTIRRLHVTNINVVSGAEGAVVRVKNDGDTKNNYAGGFLGSSHNAYIKLQNCTLQGVSVSANAAGGFIGKVTQKYLLEIYNCSADGDEKSASISGTRYAGGAVGWAIGRDYLYFQLLNFSVKDYVIQSTTTSQNMAGAGGAVGYAQGDNAAINNAANYICEFNNLTVSGCDIITNYTNKTDNYLNYKCGTGGIIGVIDTAYEGNQSSRNYKDKSANSLPYNKYKFSAYNLLIKDCTLSHKNGGSSDDNTSATNRRIGDIVGNNAVRTPLKFVGVSVENTGVYVDAETNTFCGKHVGYYDGDDNDYGTSNSVGTFGDGYMVFANQKASTENPVFANIDDTTTSTDNYTNVLAAAPYVTVNPKITFNFANDPVGDNNSKLKILTGDGVAESVAALPINTVLGDENSFYDATKKPYDSDPEVTNKVVFNRYVGKLAMFSSEVSGYSDTDFPILILDDINHDNSHEMINSYLRLLTNTTRDFGVDVDGEYKVVIYNMTYSNGVFTASTNDPSLQRGDNQFYMTNRLFDSGSIQFSLIDLRFFDPANKTQVAYHLYVPIFIKKVLTYQFDITAQSGTTYYSELYEENFGKSLIENSGSPVTIYFKYTYTTGFSSWQEAVNEGENFNRHYNKTLTFGKANSSEYIGDFEPDTILVLVDKNNGGKHYYARWGDSGVFVGNTLNLGAFKETMTYDGSSYSFSGASFDPVNLDQLLDLTVDRNDSSGKFAKCDQEDPTDMEKATVMVGEDYYRPAVGGDAAKYDITVGASSVTESYYLTVFTEDDDENDTFMYYIISSPISFNDPNYPSRIANEGYSFGHLIMGKIFDHAFYEDLVSNDKVYKLATNAEGGAIMTADNNIIVSTLNVEMGLSSNLENEVKSSLQTLMASATVYQSFVLYLNKKVGARTSKVVVGNPSASGSYTVDGGSEIDYVYVAEDSKGLININQNYAEFITDDLSGLFATRDSFIISSTVYLEYTPSAITLQFPDRISEDSGENGVTITASSNIAFSPSATSYSSNTDEATDQNNISYYTLIDQNAKLYLDPVGDSIGDCTPLGINTYGDDPPDSVSFDILGMVDITDIAPMVTDYDSAYISVSLQQRQNDGSYGSPLNITNYLTLSFDDLSSPVYDAVNSSLTITIARSVFESEEEEGEGEEETESETVYLNLPIFHFTIKTGAPFETAGLTYGNFKITVDVILLEDGTPINESSASSYIIYTNAKVITDFIDSV